MKKGLLSLLAVALTIVSCQNYDDKFDELTKIVNTLKTDVAGITDVKTTLGDLKSKVEGVTASLLTIQQADQTEEVAAVLAKLTDAAADIDKLELALADGVASAADLKVITDALALVSTNVDTLLSATGEVSGGIIINSTATLATAETFILLTSPSPAAYVVTGIVNIDHSALTADEITKANELTSKILGVGASLTTSGSVQLPKLSYVTGAYTRNGRTAPTDPQLTSVGGDLTVSGYQETISYPALTSVLGNIAISVPASVTSVDLSGITTVAAGKTFQAGAATFAKATTVNTGQFVMTSVSAAKATTVKLGQATAAGLTITAPIATLIEANSITTLSDGGLTVTATDTTNVFFTKLKTQTGSITVGTKVAQFHIPALVTVGASISVKAGVIAATAMKTIANPVTFTGASVVFPAVTSISNKLTLTGSGAAALDLGTAVLVDGGSVVSTATSIEIGSTASTTLGNILNGATGPKVVKVNAQTITVSLTATAAILTSLDITGKTTGQISNATLIDFTGEFDCIGAMTSLKLANFGDALVGIDGAPNSSLLAVTTSGNMESLKVYDLDGMTALTVGHSGWTFALAVNESIIVHDSDVLKSLDLSGLTKLWIANIDENDLLAVVTAPATTSLLANNSYGQFTVKANSIQATWTAAVAGGGDEEILNPSFTSWVKYFVHLGTQGIVATDSAVAATTADQFGFDLDYDINGVGVAGVFNAQAGATGSGTIDTNTELALIDANTP